MSLIYLKAPNNEIYEITTTLTDFDFIFNLCGLYLCMLIFIVCREETISITRNVLCLQYFQRRTTVLYLKFDYLNGRHWLFIFPNKSKSYLSIAVHTINDLLKMSTVLFV